MADDVDAYIARMQRWPDEAAEVRRILLDCGLDEALKWRKPCYGTGGNNIAILQPMKDFLALLFFKGALLKARKGILQEQGENTRSARRVCFTSVDQVADLEPILRRLVAQAIQVEKKGLTVPKPEGLALCQELQARLDGNRKLAAAFAALTPGRQREYNIHISGAKQSKTRAARVEKLVPRILAGKGMRDR